MMYPDYRLLLIFFSALNAVVAEILAELTRLKEHADSVLAGINSIMHMSYDSEVREVDEELQNVQAASSLAMSAMYNVTAHKNMSANLSNTALDAEGRLQASNALFDQMEPQIVAVISYTNEALVLINQTTVCSTALSLLIMESNRCNIYLASPSRQGNHNTYSFRTVMWVL